MTEALQSHIAYGAICHDSYCFSGLEFGGSVSEPQIITPLAHKRSKGLSSHCA
jgi:hypothetical protein